MSYDDPRDVHGDRDVDRVRDMQDIDDPDRHEGRRNAALVVGLTVVTVAMVMVMFWVINSMPGPVLASAGVPTSRTTTVDTPGLTSAAPTTTFVPPSASWTQTDTPSLPPPEQPTLSAPVPGESADPDPSQPSPSVAPPPPAPLVTNTPRPVANISNLTLSCSKDNGKKVTAKLHFTTTTQVDVILSAGGEVDRRSPGPGDVSMAMAGRGAEFCVAQVAGRTVGPIPAT